METRDENGRWLPGAQANPSGRPPVTAEERMMRENFQKAFAMLGTKSIAEIQELAKDPNQPAPYAIMAKALEWAFKKGHPGMYQQILDRTVGKVKQDIELSGDLSIRPHKELSDDELKQRIEELTRREIASTGIPKLQS